MIVNTFGWSLNFSWTPKFIEPGKKSCDNDSAFSELPQQQKSNDDVEEKNDSKEDIHNRLSQWIRFLSNKDSGNANHNQSELLQLCKTEDESCTLTIFKPSATNYDSVTFKKVKIVSKARRIEVSSKQQGYMETKTGQRVVDDYYQVDIQDLKSKDLILKFVSFTNKDYLELTNLEILVEENSLNGTYRAPGSQVAGPKIDMTAVHTMLQDMDQPLSENAQKFMNQILLMKQMQPPVGAREVDISSIMAMMASLNPSMVPNMVPHQSGNDTTASSGSCNSTTPPQQPDVQASGNEQNLETRVSNIVDVKMERLEQKMMQKLDKSVSAMEGRIMGKLDKLLAALDSGNDEADQT